MRMRMLNRDPDSLSVPRVEELSGVICTAAEVGVGTIESMHPEAIAVQITVLASARARLIELLFDKSHCFPFPWAILIIDHPIQTKLEWQA